MNTHLFWNLSGKERTCIFAVWFLFRVLFPWQCIWPNLLHSSRRPGLSGPLLMTIFSQYKFAFFLSSALIDWPLAPVLVEPWLCCVRISLSYSVSWLEYVFCEGKDHVFLATEPQTISDILQGDIDKVLGKFLYKILQHKEFTTILCSHCFQALMLFCLEGDDVFRVGEERRVE